MKKNKERTDFGIKQLFFLDDINKYYHSFLNEYKMKIDINSIWKGLWGYDIRDELEKFIESYLSYIDKNYHNIQELLDRNIKKESFIEYVAWVTMGIQFVRAYGRFRNMDSEIKTRLGNELYSLLNNDIIWNGDFIAEFIKKNELNFTYRRPYFTKSFNEIRKNYRQIRVEEKILLYFMSVLLSKPSDELPPEQLPCYNSAYNIYKKGKGGVYGLICSKMLYNELIRHREYIDEYILLREYISNKYDKLPRSMSYDELTRRRRKYMLDYILSGELVTIIDWCIQEDYYRRNIWQ